MKKVERNAPCPCGSGKKYKKCCYLDPGKNEELLRAISQVDDPEQIKQLLNLPPSVFRLKVELVRKGWGQYDPPPSCTFEFLNKQTLYDVHMDIQHAFGWDNNHLFAFFLGERIFDRSVEYSGNPYGEPLKSDFGPPAKSAAEAQLRDLPLPVGFSFWYVFDFGDELVHRVTVEDIFSIKAQESDYPILIAQEGEAPSQYEPADE